MARNQTKKAKTKSKWWQTTTIYQIYPRSYMDSNDDGVGDIPGIISRLDYIRDLGVETLWLSPFFTSPLRDVGYDIANYKEINPEYGSMADVERLIREVHKRKMRIVFDMVMNHTSDEHPWFKESRSSKDNPRRDWYIWRRGKGKKRPPTNWKAIPGNPGWNYDSKTDEWYFANFFPFQPDLNYNNPALKKEMLATVRFWLGKGIDGFRLDIFNSIYKDEEFRDNPFTWRYLPTETSFDGFFQKMQGNVNHPRNFDFAKELRAVIDEFKPARFLVGEVTGPDEVIKKYLGEQHDGLNLIFLFELLGHLNPKLNAALLRQLLHKYEATYPHPFTPTWVLGNHDRPRSISSLAGNVELAKCLALFQLTARGVPVIYYGEEIGMKDGMLPLKGAKDYLAKQYAWAPQKIVNALGLYLNRDGCRTPMQWDGSANAGFNDGSRAPWLPVNDDYQECNVYNQQADGQSLFNLYRSLLHFRKQSPALREGELTVLEADEGIVAFERKHAEQRLVVAINCSKNDRVFHNASGCNKLALFSAASQAANTDVVRLAAYSGVILQA